jgi:alkanesulfonate monooxygenase SsuD/methylene tetrahydromethanopterin reductase-like flavin-dependent oxidoreductase (luciferase family)
MYGGAIPATDGGAMVKVGLLLPTREFAISGDRDASGLVDFARRAEGLGFDSVWAGDSLVARPRVEPLTLLSAVAAVTTSIGLGTAALTGALRHPLLAAHTIASLDRLAEGRLTLGLGAGFPTEETRLEFAAAGVPYAERIGRLLETVRVWRSLWSGEDTFDGRYWSFEGLRRLPAPARPGGPPLWLAGAGQRALERAAHHFDGWLPYLPEPAEYGRQRAALDALRGPRPITPALYVTVLPQSDPRELDAYTRAYYGVPLRDMAKLQGFAYGTPHECARRLRAYTAAGAEHVVLRIGALDPAPHIETVAGIAEDIRTWS